MNLSFPTQLGERVIVRSGPLGSRWSCSGCKQTGAPRKADLEKEAARHAGACRYRKGQLVPDLRGWDCARCNFGNHRAAPTCAGCGAHARLAAIW